MEPKRSLTYDQIDLSAMEFWQLPIEEREGAFVTLRESGKLPFYKERVPENIPLPPGPGYHSLITHEQVLEASRNPEIYCSSKGATSIPDLPEPMLEFFGGMINMDDPRHAQQRRIISRGFTPRALARIEESVDRRAAAIVDRVFDQGECDFVMDIAAPLPLEIICDMMGIPQSQERMVFERTNIILGLGDPEYVPPGSDLITAAMTAGADLAGLMTELAAERRQNPKDDLTSALVNAAGSDDEVLTDSELASFFVLLVVAGNETTRNSISHGMKALCDNPEQHALLTSDYEKHAPTAVEEMVRWASPVIFMRRTVTQDTTMGEFPLKEGDKVVLWYNSANRDEKVFPQPVRVRHHAHAERPRGLRWAGTALLPGRQPRAPRDPRDVPRDLPPPAEPADHRRARAAHVQLHQRHQAHAMRLVTGFPERARGRQPA